MNPATQAVVFSSGTDDWGTPQELFDVLDVEFDFTLDAAADASNAKCPQWYGPGSAHYQNALGPLPWKGRVWCNPPYSRCAEFVAKAADSAQAGATVVVLIPSRTDTRYFHAHIWNEDTHQPRPRVEVRFIKGRVKFVREGVNNAAPFPSVIVVFHAR